MPVISGAATLEAHRADGRSARRSACDGQGRRGAARRPQDFRADLRQAWFQRSVQRRLLCVESDAWCEAWADALIMRREFTLLSSRAAHSTVGNADEILSGAALRRLF